MSAVYGHRAGQDFPQRDKSPAPSAQLPSFPVGSASGRTRERRQAADRTSGSPRPSAQGERGPPRNALLFQSAPFNGPSTSPATVTQHRKALQRTGPLISGPSAHPGTY